MSGIKNVYMLDFDHHQCLAVKYVLCYFPQYHVQHKSITKRFYY